MNCTMNTATDRAAAAIAAAELIFADEMGATLDLSPAARMALILKIADAIRAAVADGQARPGCTRSPAPPAELLVQD
jgi:hypothetical protein